MRTWFILLWFMVAVPASAAGSWQVMHSDHFNLHFDREQQALVEYILPLMAADLRYIEDRIGYRLSGRIDVFIYPSESEYLNGYRGRSEPRFTATDGGIVQVKGFDLHLYYTGDKAELLENLRIGIGSNLISEMLYGGTTQERIKYHTLLHLPDWFVKGLAQYLALGWNVDSDDELRDLFMHRKLGKFNTLSEEEQDIVGMSLWRYIDERKGDLSIPRILYLIRLTRKFETALYFVFNAGIKEIYSDWYRYNQAIYSHESGRRIPSNADDLRWHIAKYRIGQLHIGKDANNVMYVMSEPGLTELRVLDRETRQNRLLYSVSTSHVKGFIPGRGIVSHWDGSDNIWLADNLLRTGELLKLNVQGDVVDAFQHPFSSIRAICPTPVKGELLLAAVRAGKTDIFLFNTFTETAVPLTNDWNDESDLYYDYNGNFYYSASVFRESYHPELSPAQSDIFYCIRGVSDTALISNLTNSDFANETDPVKMGQSALSYLSDLNGIRNAYLFSMVPPGKAITNYRFGILDQQISPDRTQVVELMRIGDHYELFASMVDPGQVQVIGSLTPTHSQKVLMERARSARNNSAAKPVVDSAAGTAIAGSFFQTDFVVPDNVDSMESTISGKDPESAYEYRAHRGYRFRISEFHSQLDNSYFGNDLFAAYLPGEQQLRNPFGVVLGAGISDQQHKNYLTWLMRSNLSFSLTQFRLNYRFQQDRQTYRVDVWRSSSLLRSGETYFRNRSLQWNSHSEFALTDRWNLLNGLRVRKDDLIPLSTNREALLMNFQREQLTELQAGIGYKQSSVGIQGKKWTEFRLVLSGLSGVVGRKGGVLDLYGMMSRPLSRSVSWQGSFQAGHSFGSSQRLYVLGGLVQEMQADYNSGTALYDRNIAYLQPVFGLRVFHRNTRNGNSHLLWSNTYEMQLGKVLRTHALSHRWLSQLSLLGFADMGSAWVGLNPWNPQNPQNRVQISDGLLEINVYHVKSPFVFSTGTGIKTRIYGYTITYHLGWGYDNGVWNKAVSQLSLGISL